MWGRVVFVRGQAPPVPRGEAAALLTGRLHVTIVGPTGRPDPGYVRLVGPTIVPCKRPVMPTPLDAELSDSV